ncbi:uncharacterized protein FIESC28_00068 [Fusarium coffeatum]|uniref:Uncharacterized protein n=1 Tax=Fusarium coffeatum TaxID=231269 RepID=A0A366SCT4_9HYPO|nr:uncharacterized protein FIESC28_00068 [Fusarium coffeatum]RBR27124.1 hypothetical protein FIESC28_00068 [Fusarium coffeatum]
MASLKVWTVISRNYRVFDQSGRLPFTIIFGICRRDDTDPRPLRIHTKGTIFDVPYALSNDLLQLREYNPRTKQYVRLDVGELDNIDSPDQYFTLLSPVGRAGNWRNWITEYHYRVEPNSELASFFKAGKEYAVQNVSGWQLGPSAYDFVDKKEPRQTDRCQLISRRVDGQAIFEVMESLLWPPELQTKMQLKTSDNATWLAISVTNMGSEPVSVQTRGRQSFLVQHGAYDVTPDDNRPRILDENPAPEETIQILDLSTNGIVQGPRSPGLCGGRLPQHDSRPELDVLTTLRPGVPLVRDVDVSNFLSELPDGRYGLKMEPRGMWWCLGDCEEFRKICEDGRVPRDSFQMMIPPLMLECDDLVEVRVENGVAMMQSAV